MAFKDKLASFFGFGPEPELEDDATPATEAAAIPALPAASAPEAEISDEQQGLIFDRVVEVFNEALPSFLAQSVDKEKQKTALYNALDQGSKDYLAQVRATALAHCQGQWTAEREKLIGEANDLKKRVQELEQKHAQTQEKRMSADRQKRALSDRVHDLEMQVQKLEAEKEQYEIESKCMVNKTKAAAVLEKEIEELRAENNELRAARLANTLLDAPTAEPLAASTEEIDQLKSELESAKNELESTKADLETTKAELESAKTELETAKADLAQAKELEANDPGITREELEEIEEKISHFDEIKSKLDARIDKLKESLRSSQSQVKALQKANADTLHAHAQEVKRLREELAEALKAAPEPAIEEVPESALANELMSDTDWLVASPPNTPSMRPPEDREFGYQPPQRKQPQPRNDAQMSLFD